MRTSSAVLSAFVLALVVAGCVGRQTIKVEEGEVRSRKDKIQYQGGDGRSAENAVIIIGAKDQKEGVAAEYRFIDNLYGERGKGWRLTAQSVGREGDKIYDMIEMVEIASDTPHFYYFDITNCSWKPKETPNEGAATEESQ